FEIPNSSAFHVIAAFLFSKLDQSRAAETFRDCYSPGGSFSDAEFRVKCCKWLKDIMSEDQRHFSHITPSSLTSHGGHKFIRLFYWFARHVLIEDMKMNSVGIDIPFAEAVKLRPKDVYMAKARNRIAYNKLLQIFQRKDFVIQEHDIKAQLLIEEIKQIKSEYAILQTQSHKMKQNDRNTKDKTETIQKVRSMWTLTMKMLTSLKKEKEIVDSLLEDCDDQCILDGTNVVFSISDLLAYRVESDIHQSCAGNVYEAEKLNFITVIQLLNEALRILRDQCCQAELEHQFQVFENKITFCNRILQVLKTRRLAIEQQHCVTSGSVSRKEEDWKVKWKSSFSLCPLNLILAWSHHSFSLPEEDEDSVFISVLDAYNSVHEACYKEDDEALETVMDKAVLLQTCNSLAPLELSEASENREVLIEKNLHIETRKKKKRPVSPKILKNENDESTTSDVQKDAGDHAIHTEPLVKKEDLLDKARDELAEEVAKTVMSESSLSDEGKGMSLEDLISSLAFNPFLTRKQIPRTPENLLTDIRSSWRKAIQTKGSSDTELASTEAVMEEAPLYARPIMKVSDSRLMCSIPPSPVTDFDPFLSQLSPKKSQFSSTECSPQEQMNISHIIESPVSETSEMCTSERTEVQKLESIVSNRNSIEDTKQSSQYVKKSMDTPDVCRTNVLPSDYFQGSLMDRVLHWNVSSLLTSVSREAGCLGILDETLPEELDSIDPNKSASSESNFAAIDSSCVTDGSKTKGGVAPEKREEEELSSTLELFCLDEEFTKTPSPKPLNERKYSLSSVLVSCKHLEEEASMVHEIPFELIDKLKDKEQLNQKLCTKEASSA
ncbi:HAUS6 protein, partial [Bucco capensis]|nr:HAUS6 protein [Bucco capensis]